MIKHFFRKLFLVSLLVIGFAMAHGQYVTIPDLTFRNWLQSNYPSCMSAGQLDTTCNAIVTATSVVIQYNGIGDLTGIQYFDNLLTLDCHEGFISIVPALPSLLKTFIIDNNYVTSLPSLPDSLTFLDCSANQITSLPVLPAGLLTCAAQQNQLTSLPVLPNSLTYLNCTANQISALPALPPSLSVLLCASNDLTSLPVLPGTLHYLNCSINQFSSLPVLPSSIDTLDCSDNALTSLPVLPGSLLSLITSNNPLASLPVLPSSLLNLKCWYDQLTALPALPSSLLRLDCARNSITALPSLPPSLEMLLIDFNPITTLPSLPSSLSVLTAFNCQLTSLPSLPANLGLLLVPNNQLTYLPPLPASLRDLRCYNNQITWLPTLPDSLWSLDIYNNPIYCLPELHWVYDFNWYGTNIQCKPNYGNISSSNPSLASIPLCQPTDTCPFYWNISGIVFFDINGNCIQDAGDSLLKNIPVVLDSGSAQLQQMLTDNFGRYSFSTGLGTYQVRVDTTNAPYIVVCPNTFYQNSILTSIDSIDSNIDFGLQCDTSGGYDLIARSISPSWAFIPANILSMYLNAGDAMMINNISCAVGINGSVEAILNGPVSYYTYLGLPPSLINGDTITWNVTDFSIVNPATDFNIQVYADTLANIGDTICITLNIYPTTDNIPSNNSLTHCYPVVNSYDPNEKYMEPAGLVDTATQWFTFTVFFQNTGTAPAEQIYLLDTLDNDLDATTFTYLSSSHNVITQLLPGNILRFNYPNINLPDSTSDEPNSHGYVQYKVKRKAGLPVNTVISNTAYIYFDFNAAVVTNTVSATLTIPVGINETAAIEFEIYPNPVSGEFRVYGSGFGIGQLEIFNLIGEKVHSQKINSKLSIVNCQLNAGLYFIKVMNEKGAAVKRFVKQ
jgi:uncharacterized repeat protein (TIGR01451 family)